MIIRYLLQIYLYLCSVIIEWNNHKVGNDIRLEYQTHDSHVPPKYIVQPTAEVPTTIHRFGTYKYTTTYYRFQYWTLIVI